MDRVMNICTLRDGGEKIQGGRPKCKRGERDESEVLNGESFYIAVGRVISSLTEIC